MVSTLTKDVRKIIYGKLGYADLVSMRVAHNLPVDINARFANECVENGYLELLERFNPPIDGLFWAKCMENNQIHLIKEPILVNEDTIRYLIRKKNGKLLRICYKHFRGTMDYRLYVEMVQIYAAKEFKIPIEML